MGQGWKIDIKTVEVAPEETEEAKEEEKPEAEEKPKKVKKTKKEKVVEEEVIQGEDAGTDGEPVEESPAEVNAETEEMPAENPTEEK